MIFDTDVFIHLERGNVRAAELIDRTPERYLSIFTMMELLQGATNKDHQRTTRRFLQTYGFTVLSMTDTIAHRALIYVEQHALSHGLRAGDALIAATAIEQGMPLSSANSKHFACIDGLDLQVFKP